MNIILGSDPEIWAKKEDVIVCADGLVKGTKMNPHVVEGGAIQVDGFALEYNTDPAATLAEWEANHLKVQKAMLDRLDGYTLGFEATAVFSDEDFNAAPEDAKVMGCEPDYNAYTKRANPKPNGDVTFRTAGGHIHIGWGENFDINSDFHLGECRALVRVLDLFLGLPSILMDDDWQRRQLYGAAGAFRPKSYGLEYRTLSNFWTATPLLRAWAYNNTLAAIKYAANVNNPIYNVSEYINNNNKENAEMYCNHCNVKYLEEAA